MAQEVQKGQFEIFDASAYRVGIVVAQFNQDITDGLLESALETAEKYGLKREDVSVFRVAGSVEIPVVLRALAEKKPVVSAVEPYDALLALGAVIRGETDHYDYVAKIVSEGVLRVMMDYGIPVGFGVLTCDTKEQAMARAHSGGEALEAALHSLRTLRSL
ncbi:MAG: 6,7-dimethyl-8-ribityllumazine synthase [Nanoarchaeota archaeon]|nr:6,7-dimethyl-8-ribityllumazine synthase [Nanoarchaeota archaeon]